MAARVGSFKEAARELGVTPTAISHQVRTLEEQLSVALFVRKTRTVVLTEEGKRLAASTLKGFQEIHEGLDALGSSSSRLTIATTPAFAALWLVPRVADFEARHRGFTVHVETSTEPVNLERDRRIDVAIRYGTGEHPGLATIPLLEESFGAFANPELLQAGTALENTTLIETRWRSPILSPIGWDDWLEAQQLDPGQFPSRRCFDQEQHSIQAALAGQGVVLASNLLVKDMVDRGWLVEYRPEARLQGLRYTALARSDHSRTGKVRQFLAWLEREAGG
ncbi:LysR family transcriptional regulator [Qipengyuania flava]|jgi:DNA-binding transcriptional LysR family regulator|nr:LysR family transcriptional regulator [Qipengyuania flava]